MSRQKRNAAYHTLGCKLNFAESATVARLLASRGIGTVEDDAAADIIVVNTCSVTAEADKKCRSLVRRLHRVNPRAAIVVTGCSAQLRAAEYAALEGVAVVAGNDRKDLIGDYLDRLQADDDRVVEVGPSESLRRFTSSCAHGNRTRWFLKIQDGCDYRCSYCTIPIARGMSRSPMIADILEQARGVAADGGREIVLTGVNIGDFGRRNGERFFDLCRGLDDIDGIERYRISSIEPNLLTDELIDWLATESRRFMPHFHIPLQAGSDEVLRLMGRRYDTSLFRRKIERIRSLIPDAFIGVDLIVGMRGETPELFEASRRFVESLPITRLHVFPYSERGGTRALDIYPVVDQAEKHRRVAVMTAISDARLAAFARSMGGTRRKVLLEDIADAHFRGHTDNYLYVSIPADDPRLVSGKTVEVTLLEANEDGTVNARL